MKTSDTVDPDSRAEFYQKGARGIVTQGLKMPRKKKPVSEEPLIRLMTYWLTAEVMRTHYVEIVEEVEDMTLDEIRASPLQAQYTAYLGFWLASLFVVVEGFNKCGFKHPVVQRLFNSHLGELKAMRHEMFHFIPFAQAQGHLVISKLNWASKLHETLGGYIRWHVGREVKKEKAAKRRNRKRRTQRKLATKEPHVLPSRRARS
jgi:hypothetical protein